MFLDLHTSDAKMYSKIVAYVKNVHSWCFSKKGNLKCPVFLSNNVLNIDQRNWVDVEGKKVF